MDAVRYLKERDRMCERFPDCEDCLFHQSKNGKSFVCTGFEKNYPEESVSIVKRWSKENQIVTNKMKFEEVFGRDLYDGKGSVLMPDWLSEEYKEPEEKKGGID